MNEERVKSNRINTIRPKKLIVFTALLLCLCIMGSIFLNVTFVVSHHDHHCTGAHCTVCEQIIASIDHLREVGKSFIPLGMLLLLGSSIVELLILSSRPEFKKNSLVSQKVRLNI